MATALLADRGVIEVAGRDAADFLNRLLTNLVPELSAPQASYAALLTPQGKVLADMLIVRHPHKADGFLLDCAKLCMGEVLKRFTIYKLRADISFKDASEDWSVLAAWEDPEGVLWEHLSDDRLVIRDPRHAGLGQRAFTRNDPSAIAQESAYHAHRIRLGIAEGGTDFNYGEVFAHEINLDHVHGLDFNKGCYVGQEIVSRMEHRGTARNRIVPITFPEGLAPQGSDIIAGSLVLGHVGSVTNAGHGLALLRLDRVQDAQAKGQIITAGGCVCIPAIPDWATHS